MEFRFKLGAVMTFYHNNKMKVTGIDLARGQGVGIVEMSGNISNKYTILYSTLGFLARFTRENCMAAYSGFC